jgi:hypothetical protein
VDNVPPLPQSTLPACAGAGLEEQTAKTAGTTAPAVMFIYRRPETTARVFKVIQQVRPSQLFVVANAPKHPDEQERCAQARQVVSTIDWPCEVRRHYAEQHLSCKASIVGGLDWVFSQVDRAIILEDDCVPHPSFFEFCTELLERYQDDERIASIAGTAFHRSQCASQTSYSFSRYNLFWGWATWRRVWQTFDPHMTQWPTVRQSGFLHRLFSDKRAIAYWDRELQRVYEGHDTWDWQWLLSQWQGDRVNIVPHTNLVSNIGFGSSSTHTRDAFDWRANMRRDAMPLPLSHPTQISLNAKTERMIQRRYYERPANRRSPLERTRRKLFRARKLVRAFSQTPQQGLITLLRHILWE